MAVKRKNNPNNSKENLTWKLNVLAAKTGEDTHIEQAKIAALGKRQQGEGSQGTGNSEDQEKYVKELNQIKKKKLESKLFHIRKEIKSGLKKSKALETTKQSRKLREAQEYVGSTTNSSTDQSTEAHGKKSYTAQDVERFQKELDILKTIDMEQLSEKVLTKFIQKNATLKKDDTISALLSTTTDDKKESMATSTTTDNDKLLVGNIEARLLGNKALTEPLKKSMGELEFLLLDPEQRKLVKESKRKAVATEQRSSSSKQQKPIDKIPSTSSGSSLFMDSLGDSVDDSMKDQPKKTKKNISSTDWEDPDFDKYYNGKRASEKANRPGQSQRRRKWEAIHGEKAKHLVEGKLPSRDQREFKKQKRLQKEAARAAAKNDNNIQGGGNLIKKKEENLEEFHPSWQAKRQQQEMMAKALSGKSAGNKIVFGDDD